MGNERKEESLSLDIIGHIRDQVANYITSRQKTKPTYHGDNKKLETHIMAGLLGNDYLIAKVIASSTPLDEQELKFVTEQIGNAKKEQKIMHDIDSGAYQLGDEAANLPDQTISNSSGRRASL